MVKTMADWEDDEREDVEENNPMEPAEGESPEEFFKRTGYGATEPGSPGVGGMDKREPGSYRSPQHQQEVSQFMAVQDQMVMEASGFGKELVAYFHELIKGQIPFQAVIVLTREWQQAEINRRTNLDALERRLDHEQ